MDALQLMNKTRTDESRTRALVLACIAAVSLGVGIGCSSNSKPKALPPQTMAPKPPEIEEPVSNTPQELEPEAHPNPTTGVEPTAGSGTSRAESANPTTIVIEPSTSRTGEAGTASSDSSSLYQAASEERERRQAAGESKIVLNDKNLKDHAKGQLTFVEGEEAVDVDEEITGDEAAVTSESTDADSDDPPDADDDEIWEQEQYWRDRVLDIRIAWRESLDSITDLEQEIATLRRDFYAEDDPFYRDSQIKPAWDHAIDELAEARREVERRERELEDTLEEGRREGALPGWLREGIELEPTEEEMTLATEEEGEFHEPSEPVIVEDDGGGS